MRLAVRALLALVLVGVFLVLLPFAVLAGAMISVALDEDDEAGEGASEEEEDED